MTPNGVLEAALYVDDLDAARAFYGGLLGLPEIAAKEGRHVFYRCGETIVLLFRADASLQPVPEGAYPVPPHGTTGPGHLCFAVQGSELDGWVSTLQQAGVEIESDFQWYNGARSVYVRDPAGNSIEFAEPRLWEPAS